MPGLIGAAVDRVNPENHQGGVADRPLNTCCQVILYQVPPPGRRSLTWRSTPPVRACIAACSSWWRPYATGAPGGSRQAGVRVIRCAKTSISAPFLRLCHQTSTAPRGSPTRQRTVPLSPPRRCSQRRGRSPRDRPLRSTRSASSGHSNSTVSWGARCRCRGSAAGA